MKKFHGIEYKGGHPKMTRPCKVDVLIFDEDKYIKLNETGWGSASVVIYFSDIIGISLDNKSKRSLGKAAAGAVIGGVLTGGVGLLAGGLLGGRSKNDSSVYLTIMPNKLPVNIILNGGKQSDALYAELAALL